MEDKNTGTRKRNGLKNGRWNRPAGMLAFLGLSVAGLASLCGADLRDAGKAAQPRPNIVIIMLDDMGYSDLGSYGGEVKTPHMDRLGMEGLRFTQFYNSSRCTPTRASLLTGLWPHQVNAERINLSLSKNGATIAEILRQAGYQTAMVGKWHLSGYGPRGGKRKGGQDIHQNWITHQVFHDEPFADLESYPVNRGFERHYGTIWGVNSFFDPFSLVEGVEPIREVPQGYYYTDAITEKAVEYIAEMSREDAPFFLYVAHFAPHWPLHALPEDIARYQGVYDGGWERIRQDRYARQVEMGLLDPATHPLPPLTEAPDWKTLDERKKRYEASMMEVHAAMIDRVDQGVGQIIEELRESGRLDNTVIFVLSDNGASPERRFDHSTHRPRSTRDGRTIQYKGFFDPGPDDTWGYIGSSWASAANTPFRYWKMQSFEGGCRTPLIVYGPERLIGPGGRLVDQPGHVIDLMPTCLAMAGVEYPAAYKGHTLLPLEGSSLLPVFRGASWPSPRELYFEHENGKAFRRGDWKLVAHTKDARWHLYNLKEDATETQDLAEKYPERAREMVSEWQAWAKRVGAMPPAP
jgi:arylsulfatase A-like enzyme